MRALLTPELAPRLGVVLFKPGSDVMNLFRQGRVLIENVPDHLQSLPSGHVPAASQPLADDAALHPFLTDERVILAAGCHNALHADVAAFEQKYGTQLELLFRFLDRVLAIGVIATAKKNSGDKNA